MMNFGVAESALVILVIDRFVNFARILKNGKSPPNGVANAKLDRIIAQGERQITLLQDIAKNGRD